MIVDKSQKEIKSVAEEKFGWAPSRVPNRISLVIRGSV